MAHALGNKKFKIQGMFSLTYFKSTFLFAFLTLLFMGNPCCGQILPGAQQTDLYLPFLKNKKVGVVAHAASQIYLQQGKSTHLIDTLLAHEVFVIRIFAPEHGFRSREDNGALIKDEIDSLTQLPIISLHGKNKKPQPEQLQDLDIIVFDLQDVGARFYTYLSTLHLVMEACAENNLPLLILDRPNPNGHFVDGPVLEDHYKSYLGMHPIPIVHGLTLGEFAQMINGEGWLEQGIQCDVRVVKTEGYTHKNSYNLPVRPSPNLPNAIAINLYPSLCLFERTVVSIGRGTELQFQIYGHPLFEGDFSFTPQPNFGAKYPKLEGEKCLGKNLQQHPYLERFEIKWLLETYAQFPEKESFFMSRFAYLAGTEQLEKQIKNGWTENAIRASWEPQLSHFKKLREKYLLYPN